MSEHDESHGHSPAAWIAVGILIVASLVMSIAVVIASVPWFVIGGVLAVVGAASGKVLAMAGYGARASTRSAAKGERVPAADLPGKSQHDSGTR